MSQTDQVTNSQHISRAIFSRGIKQNLYKLCSKLPKNVDWKRFQATRRFKSRKNIDFPVESYSFLPGSRAILDLSYRSHLCNSNYIMSQQSRPTISMHANLVPRLFTYARHCGKDPGCSWSPEPPDFRVNRISAFLLLREEW